jgi:hypothetical protein
MLIVIDILKNYELARSEISQPLYLIVINGGRSSVGIHEQILAGIYAGYGEHPGTSWVGED